eukprot:CAMPEP_0202977518 /NCGR_PEP_ID=MMETSP1396-20130829/84291_1 /ASSEMBLY_ACC=CAM_ASM_000872 /TAXON_ID= /ORGANISM="Pseudokeronopsis sp., Strain Brazil" /LENGTH=205 /DNA_ID=CAMNT_0049716269 /DNA_START=386 /DNA_END=1003 /DNA_ORIENTATION=+
MMKAAPVVLIVALLELVHKVVEDAELDDLDEHDDEGSSRGLDGRLDLLTLFLYKLGRIVRACIAPGGVRFEVELVVVGGEVGGLPVGHLALHLAQVAVVFKHVPLSLLEPCCKHPWMELALLIGEAARSFFVEPARTNSGGVSYFEVAARRSNVDVEVGYWRIHIIGDEVAVPGGRELFESVVQVLGEVLVLRDYVESIQWASFS